LAVDPGIAGLELGPWTKSWTADDCMLYALGVGCGWDDLEYVTENSEGVALRVLPTFAVRVGIAGPGFSFTQLGDVPLESIVHGDQRIEVFGAIPTSGTVVVRGRIVGVYDKGSGALVVTEWDSSDAESGELRFRTSTGLFLRGQGGFGGPRGPSPVGGPVGPPEREPDRVVTHETLPIQTLLYRLSGDHNRIHSDPWFARRAGFEQPILMGLLTFGYAGRALVAVACDGDPARLRVMEGRFSKPGYNGDRLATSVWIEADGDGWFATSNDRGDVLLDRGRFTRA